MALHALRDATLQKRIKAIICLATPFIHSIRRESEIGIASLASIIGGWAGVLTGCAVFYFPLLLKLDTLFEHWPVAWSIGCLLFAAGAFEFAKIGCTNFLQFHAQRIQSNFYEQMSLTSLDTPVYALRYTSDEARTYLRLLHSMSSLPYKTLSGVMASRNFLVQYRECIGPSAELARLLTYGLVWITIPIWLTIVLGHIVLRWHRYSFGEQIAEGLLLAISVHDEPPTAVNRILINFRIEDYHQSMLHSFIYRDPIVLDEIARILEEDKKGKHRFIPHLRGRSEAGRERHLKTPKPPRL